MGAKSTGNGRARGWVLVQAEQAQEVAEGLYEEMGHKGGDSFVVVRADIVAGSRDFPYNIIVPVDAESKEVLSDLVDQIRGVNGVGEAVIVKVDQHVPYPPHDAQGYITEQEVEAGEDKEIEPGRQGASPGANPFG